MARVSGSVGKFIARANIIVKVRVLDVPPPGFDELKFKAELLAVLKGDANAIPREFAALARRAVFLLSSAR
jgi:hypothetical protein